MKIEQLTIKNYKVFHDVVIDNIGNMAVFLGQNGAGKTTLFDVFAFMKKCLNENVTSALQARGGFDEVRSRDQDGDIELEFKYRTDKNKQLYTYQLKIGKKGNKPVVTREVLQYKRSTQAGAPWMFVDFSEGKGKAITNESMALKNITDAVRQEYQLASPDILAIKSLGQLSNFPAAALFRKLIEEWFISDLQIDASRQVQDIAYNEQVSTSGDNLANAAMYLHDHYPERFQGLLDKMKTRIPGISNVEARPTDDGRIVLRFADGKFKDPFTARFVSDGTIKMFAYLLMLADPKRHSLLCIEEPENQLYPHLLAVLAEEFRSYAASNNQVFISTHSPDFINAVELPELYCIYKSDGYSEIKKVSKMPLVKDLYQAGDKLGSLWKQGLLDDEVCT